MTLLTVDNVSVRFGGLHALRQVNLEVAAGTITGLIGPNGAGKTTLFNVVSGLQPPTNGDIFFGDRCVTRHGVHRRARLGIARTFQRLEAFNSLSVRDNVLVASENASRQRRKGLTPAQIADAALEMTGLTAQADITVGTMPTASARLVEFARALATGPELLLLDEASSGLNDEETNAIGQVIRDVVAATGLAVLLVEHDMSFVMGLCATIHVLDLGEIIASGIPSDVQANERVQHAYLGAPKKPPKPASKAAAGHAGGG